MERISTIKHMQMKQYVATDSSYDTKSAQTIWFDNIPRIGLLYDAVVVAKPEIVDSNLDSITYSDTVQPTLRDSIKCLVDYVEVQIGNTQVNCPNTLAPYFSIKEQEKIGNHEPSLNFSHDTSELVSGDTITTSTVLGLPTTMNSYDELSIVEQKMERISRLRKLGFKQAFDRDERYELFSLRDFCMIPGAEWDLNMFPHFDM